MGSWRHKAYGFRVSQSGAVDDKQSAQQHWGRVSSLLSGGASMGACSKIVHTKVRGAPACDEADTTPMLFRDKRVRDEGK